MRLADSAIRAARKSEFYRKSGVFVVPLNKGPFNNITAMWRAGWRVALVHRSARGSYHLCYKRRGLLARLLSRLLP